MGLEGIPTPRRLGFREKRSCRETPVATPPVCRVNRQVAGGHSTPVYTRRSHLTSGAPKGRSRVRQRNSAREAGLWPHFTGVAWGHRVPGVTVSPQVLSRSRAEVGGEPQLPGLREERPARLQHNLHIPRSAQRAHWNAEQRWPGEAVDPGARPSARRRPEASPHRLAPQLPNSGTFAKLLRAGDPPRSGPHHRGREGGEVCARTPRRAGGPRRTAARFCAPAHGARQPICRRSERGERAARARERRGPATPPPQRRRGGPARLPGWRAAEVPRSWSGAGAVAASPRRAAAAGRAGGLTLGAGGRAAGPAGRGGADRPR